MPSSSLNGEGRRRANGAHRYVGLSLAIVSTLAIGMAPRIWLHDLSLTALCLGTSFVITKKVRRLLTHSER